MAGPNQELLSIYSTEPLQKQAEEDGLPLAVRIAAAILGMALIRKSLKHQEHVIEEGDATNELDRQEEAKRMEALINSLHKQGSAQYAISIGKKLAIFEKDAFPVPSIGTDSKALSKLKIPHDITHLVAHGAVHTPHVLGGHDEAKIAFPVMEPIGKVMGAASKAFKPGFKSKALLAAGVLGTGYVGAKGLQATRDYMLQPPNYARWGASGAPAANVSEYGYPTP